MEKRMVRLLENLEAEKQAIVLELASEAQRLSDVLKPLREHGIEVSVATLTRFVRRHRERQMLADGEDMKEAVEGFSKRGRGEAFRKGTLEAMRQRLYEQALTGNSPEETRKIYGELLKEEARLKELELAERRVALAEEQAKLEAQRLKLEVNVKCLAGTATQRARSFQAKIRGSCEFNLISKFDISRSKMSGTHKPRIKRKLPARTPRASAYKVNPFSNIVVTVEPSHSPNAPSAPPKSTITRTPTPLQEVHVEIAVKEGVPQFSEETLRRIVEACREQPQLILADYGFISPEHANLPPKQYFEMALTPVSLIPALGKYLEKNHLHDAKVHVETESGFLRNPCPLYLYTYTGKTFRGIDPTPDQRAT